MSYIENGYEKAEDRSIASLNPRRLAPPFFALAVLLLVAAVLMFWLAVVSVDLVSITLAALVLGVGLVLAWLAAICWPVWGWGLTFSVSAAALIAWWFYSFLPQSELENMPALMAVFSAVWLLLAWFVGWFERTGAGLSISPILLASALMLSPVIISNLGRLLEFNTAKLAGYAVGMFPIFLLVAAVGFFLIGLDLANKHRSLRG